MEIIQRWCIVLIEMFSFLFSIFGSFLNFLINEFKIDGNITFGRLLIVVFLVCFIISKIFGMAHSEMEEEVSISKAVNRRERMRDLEVKRDRAIGGRHSSATTDHNRKG